MSDAVLAAVLRDSRPRHQGERKGGEYPHEGSTVVRFNLDGYSAARPWEGPKMGILPQELALYHSFAQLGLFRDVRSVFDIGATDIQCAGYEDAVSAFFSAMGKPIEIGRAKALTTVPAKTFYSELGIDYWSMDASGLHQSIPLDLNFDDVPTEHIKRHDLVTNFGTTEHAINQLNCFKIAHDLTKPGGLMIHDVPFGGAFSDLCFFSYNQQLFLSLARANGYEVLGIWLSPDTSLPTFIPMTAKMLNFIDLKLGSTSMIAVLMRKVHDADFMVPYQHRTYESTMTDEVAARYTYMVDGEMLDGRTVKRIAVRNKMSLYAPETMPIKKLGRIFFGEFTRRVRKRLFGAPKVVAEKQERVYRGHH
jgi:hypothetical protein